MYSKFNVWLSQHAPRVQQMQQPMSEAQLCTLVSEYSKQEVMDVILAMENYADLLKEQILLYDADVILCIGGQGVMVNFIRQHVYQDLEEVNPHCYYSAEANILVVKQYHPNYNVYSRQEMYTSLMKDYQAFLNAYPVFPRQR